MSVDTYTMTPETFAALRDQAFDIRLQDREVGLMFQEIILHLGHLYGLDPAKEDVRLAKEALDASRKEEDARLQADADARAKVRAAEDAQTNLNPDQVAARTQAREAEDAQTKADAVALQERRDAEDARMQEALDAAAQQAAAAQPPAPSPAAGAEQAPAVEPAAPAVEQPPADAPTDVAQTPPAQPEGEL